LGVEISQASRFLLAALAWEMTRHPDRVSEDDLTKLAMQYLRAKNDLGEDRAEILGTQFILSKSRRSGIILRSGEAYGWLHPTFREYLAAWHLVRTEQLESVKGEIPWDYYYLFYPELKEVSLFIINILDGIGGDVPP
jgi:hypothetical protein